MNSLRYYLSFKNVNLYKISRKNRHGLWSIDYGLLTQQLHYIHFIFRQLVL
jgi:hypothetical protein